MKVIKISIFVFIFILISLVAVLFYLQYKKTHITTDNAYVCGHIHWISPRIEGTVLKVLVDDNELVKEGEVLLTIDPERYEVKLSQARASLSLAKWKLREAKVNFQAAQANLTLAKAQFEQAKIDLNRAEALFKKAAVSKEKYDHALTHYKVTKASLDVAKEKLSQAKVMIDIAKAQVEDQEAQVNDAMLDIKYTIIKAPVTGYITKRSVEVGHRVKPGMPLLAMVPLSNIWIEANYKETQLERIKVGQKVTIKVDTYPGKKFYGRVESIQAGSGAVFSLFPPENATGNWVKVVQRIPVKIVLEEEQDPNLPLRIGMSVITTVLARD
ncbi:MAG: hypothetical protein AMJ45_04450 [Syntrophobacter sp. DG_60]|nr:MAG: hypothetical protein AMJ45_04450 [Syntrophobacter sp. DG_60]